MIVPDVNVLVALARADHVHHEAAQAWWDRNDEPFAVPDVVATGALRLLTSAKVFVQPASLDDGLAFLSALAAQPHALTWAASPRTMTVFESICRDAHATGELVPDAYIAACAASFDGTVVTFDRDYRRFRDVRVQELIG